LGHSSFDKIVVVSKNLRAELFSLMKGRHMILQIALYTLSTCPFSQPSVTHSFDRVLDDSEELRHLGRDISPPTP
jgi:hypothetical protein